ncbi:Putative F-box/FBD/LRR-repeat protein At5g56810 [Linum perenne]
MASNSAFKEQSALKHTRHYNLVDWISTLPDEILVNIISLLKFSEALSTSLLSSKWIHLWKSAVSVLDFDGLKLLDISQPLLPAEPMGMNKRVEYLDLSFGVMSDVYYFQDHGDYSLSGDCYDYIKTPAGLSNIKHLRSLRLSYVDVEEETLEYIIFSCPLLQELAVYNASSLYDLWVLGSPSSPLALKYLEVTSCDHLSSMLIDHAPSLTHLVHNGLWTDVHVENCASLVDVDISFVDRYELPAVAFSCLSAYAGQLEFLSLGLDPNNILFSEVDELTSLEQLKIRVTGAKSYHSILGLVPLINACPRLHTLRVELTVEFDPDWSDCGGFTFEDDRVYRDSIKVVEIINFNGYDVDCEFVEYVMEYFTGLERIVIERGGLDI